MKFRKKPVVIDAYQWFEVSPYVEGKKRDVDYYRQPGVDGACPCDYCGKRMHDHGFIDTLEDGHRVCPGDWIITGWAGERYPCKPHIFEATYDPVTGSEPDPIEAYCTSVGDHPYACGCKTGVNKP